MRQTKPILLIDDECVFCNKTVGFIMRNGGEEKFRFISLYSPEGKEILKEHAMPEDYTDSVVLIERSRVYLKSEAVLRIARELSGLVKIISWAKIIPPRFRNTVYDMIASHRHKLI